MKKIILGLFGMVGTLCPAWSLQAAEPIPVLNFSSVKASLEKRALNPTIKDVAAAFWIRFDNGLFFKSKEADKASFGLFDCFRAEDGRIGVTIFPKKTELMKPVTMYSKIKAKEGQWYHVEFAYSMNMRRYTLYVDGVFQMENDRLLMPMPDFSLFKIGEGFGGEIKDFKFYDAALPSEELSLSKATADDYDAIKKEIASIQTKNPYLRRWLTDLSTCADTYKSKIGNISTAAHKRLVKFVSNAKVLAAGITNKNTVSDHVVTTYVTPSTSNALYLPYDLPENGSVTNEINLVMAQDEFETASVIVFPFCPVKKFTLQMGDLKCGNNILKGADADIKIVKRWYRTGGAWMSYHTDLYMRVLTPDMMLYDDSLVEVDEFRRTNKIRMVYPSGTEYADVSEFRYQNEFLNAQTMDAVRDAATLQPACLKEAGRNLQYLLTFRTKKGTAPGLYKGHLNLLADGKAAGSLTVAIKVLPFVLPQPKTYEDTSRPYISHVNYSIGTEAGIRYAMDHNIMHLSRIADTKDHMRLAVKLGYPLDVVFDAANFRGNGWDFGGPEEKRTPEFDAQMERMVLAPFLRREKVFEKITGKKDYIMYRCHTSEAGWYDAISRGPDQLSAVLNAKTKTRLFAHGMSESIPTFSPGIYDMDSATSRRRAYADIWHSVGGRAITYAFPFPGPESPGLMRRTLGLELYKHDRYDGHMLHGFIGTQLNEFTKYPGGDGDYRNFDIALRAADGKVIECLPSVGYREAYDDVRYATALKVQAEEVLKASNDELVRKEAKRQLAWLERVDGVMTDMDAFKAGAQYRIVTLQNLINARKGK